MNGNFLVLRFFGHRRRRGRVGGAAELKSRSLRKSCRRKSDALCVVTLSRVEANSPSARVCRQGLSATGIRSMLMLDISAGDAHIFAHKLEARPYLSQLSRRAEAKLRLGSCARVGKRAMAAITMSTSIRPDPDALFCLATARFRRGWHERSPNWLDGSSDWRFSMTRYVALVDGKPGSYGVTVPDLPGCTSAAATTDEVLHRATEAVRLWAEDALADGEKLPKPRSIEALRADPEVAEALAKGAALAIVPLVLDAGRPAKANLSLDAGLLAAIDEAAAARGLTRSAFLASAAREKIESEG